MAESILFIVNPVAGTQSVRIWRRVEAELKRKGCRTDQVLTTGPGDAIHIAKEKAASCNSIIAVGGDGTVFETLSGIMASSAASRPSLGIVPGGTGNDSARTVGINNELAAVKALTEGRTRLIDVIRIECRIDGAAEVRHALLFASVGASTELLRNVTPGVRRLFGGQFAYLAALLLSLPRLKPTQMRISIDGAIFEGPHLFACASNGETFGGGIRIAPGAEINDGRLNINLVKAAGRWEVLMQLQKLRQGRHTNHPRVIYRTGENISVDIDRPGEVAADGDLIGWTPARFQVCPNALNVLTP